MPLDEIFKNKIGYDGVLFNPPLDTPNMAISHYRAEIGHFFIYKK